MKKADDGIPQTVAPIEEIQLYVRDASGNRIGVSMQELVDRTMGTSLPRADLHISRARDGELLLTSRQDGMIRMLVPDSTATAAGTPATLIRRPKSGRSSSRSSTEGARCDRSIREPAHRRFP